MSKQLPQTVQPRAVGLEASSFCQLRCPSCPTTAGAIHPAVGSGFLRFEDFRRLVDLNPFLQRVELANYGEVFLNPQLLQILEYAHRHGIAITLENGVNLNNARDETLEGLVKYKVRVITCSIDGASAETYRTYRVRGNFDRVMRNIEKLNAWKRQYQSELPKLIWQFVVFGHNEHEIPTARTMATRLGMEFWPKLSWGQFSPIRDKEFVRTEIGGGPVTREEHEQAFDRTYLSGICHQLWDKPQINWDGKILGCCRNFWGDFGANAFSDGLTESINSEKMAYARDMLTGRRPPRDDIPCTTCDMYHAMCTRGNFMDTLTLPDQKWIDVALFLRREARESDVTAAPKEFRYLCDHVMCEFLPEDFLKNVSQPGAIVILHKGRLDQQPRPALVTLLSTTPIFANEVFVLFSEFGTRIPAEAHPHIDPIKRAVA
jgi:MoaA/NifB/PqqE/SkfB family radical SAM enzyme